MITPNDDLSNLIIEVYKQVWHEFYAWELDYSSRAVASLAPKQIRPYAFPTADVGTTESISSAGSDSDSDDLQLILYDLDSGMATLLASTAVVEVASTVPEAQYESVAPLHCNRRHGDDPSDLAFIPYADHSDFDWSTLVLDYRRCAWQSNGLDPDHSAIFLEVARRLHHVHDVDPIDIDKTRILPTPLCFRQKPGLLSVASQNDHLHWSSTPYSLPHDVMDPPDARHLVQNIQNMLSIFCDNPTCNEAWCISHECSEYLLEDLIQVKKADVSGSRAVLQAPCGPDCFSSVLSRHGSNEDVLSTWSAIDQKTLLILLSADPTASPCDVSVICKKPCREIHACIRHIRESANSTTSTTARQVFNAKPVFAADSTPNSFTPGAPCPHPGPCDADAQCECFLKQLHCERNCRCDKTCVRRWRGCNCVSSIKPTFKACGRNCPCSVAGRECDPELCSSHLFSRSHATCRNSQLQYNLSKGVDVKTSKWGHGLFLLEDVHSGDLIIEYVGEMIYEATFLSRDQLSNYRGRNYVFGLNGDFDLDSSYAGNESRFINHAPNKQANCMVKIMLVNGDHRIGVYARRKITAGSELFLDYGPEFFQKTNCQDPQ